MFSEKLCLLSLSLTCFVMTVDCFSNEVHHHKQPTRRYHRHHHGLGSPLKPPGYTLPDANWFTQDLDHFKPTDDRTWKQRFWINDTFWRPGNAAFLMIGGEGPANPIWMVTGTWIEYAKAFGAICFQLEHRYYGDSHPTEDMGVKNLAWLTSEQALADLANFITEMNSQYKISAWIAFGGSYPGSLAAWLRLKYPHLVAGAISTSGPLIAKADFPEYLNVVSNALDQTNPKCNPLVKEGLSQAKKLINHPLGWRLLTNTFQLCSPFNATSSNDVANLFEAIIGNFEDIVQYNRDNRNFEGIATANITIDTLCDIMTQFQASPLKGLGEVNSLMLKATDQKCLNYTYSDMIEDLSNVNWKSEAGAGGRQWTYQTCTEFGWYQSSNQIDHPYTDLFPVEFFEKQCTDIFGPKFTVENLERNIKRTNKMYGGLDIQVSNVVFVHGTFDPWHALGITQSISENSPAILIPGTSHCANMYPSRDDDPPQLEQARKTIGMKIQDFLKGSSQFQSRQIFENGRVRISYWD